MGVLTVISLSQMPNTTFSACTSADLSLMAYVTTGTAAAKRFKSSAYGSAAHTASNQSPMHQTLGTRSRSLQPADELH